MAYILLFLKDEWMRMLVDSPGKLTIASDVMTQEELQRRAASLLTRVADTVVTAAMQERRDNG